MTFFSPIRKLVRFIVCRYYRRVRIDGADSISEPAPMLFCANHPNSLFDPIMVGIAVRRPVYFLAKAPLFRMPVVGAILHGLGMIPAYRGRDNAGDVSRNQESLESAANVLLKNESIGIFPEGKSHDRIGLEMVRSGAARIALAARQQGLQHLKVVPIGLNYEDKERFRSDVWIQMGSPIDLDQWCQEQEGSETQLRRKLSDEIQRRLKQCVIHLDDADWEHWLDVVELMLEGAPIGTADGSRVADSPLVRRKNIARLMNQFLESNMDLGQKLGQEIGELESELSDQDIEFNEFARTVALKKPAGTVLWQSLYLLALLPIAFLGTVHHVIPFGITRALAARFQSRVNRTDVSLYRILFSLPIYALAYAVIGILLAYMTNLTTAIIWLLFAPAAGILAFEYWPAVVRFFKTQRQHAKISLLRKSSSRAENEYHRLSSALREVVANELSKHS